MREELTRHSVRNESSVSVKHLMFGLFSPLLQLLCLFVCSCTQSSSQNKCRKMRGITQILYTAKSLKC